MKRRLYALSTVLSAVAATLYYVQGKWVVAAVWTLTTCMWLANLWMTRERS